MRILVFTLIFLLGISLNAQDNKLRAESMIAMAVQKEAEGGKPEEFNPLFEQAIQFTPDDAVPYLIWGYVIAKHAEENKDTELLESCFDKFRKALEIKPDYAEVYSTWAICLSYYANESKNDSLYDESFRKFAKAVELEPNATETYMNWGRSLLDYAKETKKTDDFRQSIEKFDKVLELDANSMPAWRDKGYAYLSLGRYEKNYPKYRTELETSLTRAEQLGSQSAAYNMACYYSLIKEKDEAFKWLEKSMIKAGTYQSKMYNFTKEKMDSDDDLKNIRRDKRYKQLTEMYFKQ